MDQKLSGKTYVITGATSGIGLATAELLASMGANIIGIGRTIERCAVAEASLKELRPEGFITWCAADLSLRANVHTLAIDIQQHLHARGLTGLDGLLNNAGTVPFHQTLTADGMDTQWAVNHMAPFILSIRLLPLLRLGKSARIVTVSSGSHYRARIHWDDIQLFNRYATLRAYGQSKLCNVLFSVELDRRIAGSGMRAFAADPGLVDTDIGMKCKSLLASMAWSLRRRGGMPAHDTAPGIAFLLTEPSIQGSEEVYWKHGKPKTPNPVVLDGISATRLWDISVGMSGISKSEMDTLLDKEKNG